LLDPDTFPAVYIPVLEHVQQDVAIPSHAVVIGNFIYVPHSEMVRRDAQTCWSDVCGQRIFEE
jgi:hypothetical protein